jgi:uncharacterized alpha-E superfamily protein
VYRESLKPRLIADLLILNLQLPRSLAICHEKLVHFCDSIAPPMATSGCPSARSALSTGRRRIGSVSPMAGRISMGARREVVAAVTERYRSAKRAEKGRILDEQCAMAGWHRKHAVRAVRQHDCACCGRAARLGLL